MCDVLRTDPIAALASVLARHHNDSLFEITASLLRGLSLIQCAHGLRLRLRHFPRFSASRDSQYTGNAQQASNCAA